MVNRDNVLGNMMWVEEGGIDGWMGVRMMRGYRRILWEYT